MKLDRSGLGVANNNIDIEYNAKQSDKADNNTDADINVGGLSRANKNVDTEHNVTRANNTPDIDQANKAEKEIKMCDSNLF